MEDQTKHQHQAHRATGNTRAAKSAAAE